MTYETIPIKAKDASGVHILTGTVTDIDTKNITVDVDIDDYGSFSDVPVFYHCEDSKTADGMPFSKNDRVIIVNSGDAITLSISNMKVVGSEDGLPRHCYWFYDSFDTLDLDVWDTTIHEGGSIVSTGGRLKYTVVTNGFQSYLYRTEDRTYPTNFDIIFNMTISGTYATFMHYLDIGTYLVAVDLYRGTHVQIEESGGSVLYEVVDYHDENIDWKFEVRGTLISIYRNGDLIIADKTIRTYDTVPTVKLGLLHAGTIYFNDYTIIQK